MKTLRHIFRSLGRDWKGYLLAIALVAAATWLKYLAQPNIIPANVPILYLLAIVPTAIFFGIGPAILVCLLSLFAFDFFFIPPLHTAAPNIASAPILLIFLLVGLSFTLLAGRLRNINIEALKEIAARKDAEVKLLSYRNQLEELVKERTAELETVNAELRGEIQERQKIEEQQKTLINSVAVKAKEWQDTFDAVPDMVMLLAPDHTCIRVNKATAKFLNIPIQEIIGKKCFALMHGLCAPIAGCPCEEAKTSGKPESAEITDRGKYYIATASPVVDENGKLAAFAHTVKDNTLRKEAEHKLIAQDRLVSLGQLVSGVAHELNNPLTSVVGFSDLLLHKDLPPDVKEDLKIIHQEANRTSQIVKNLLTFARQKPGKKETHDINLHIRTVLELRTHEHTVHNIKVVERFGQNLPKIFGNCSQLQQVFLNLIINAEQSMIEARGSGTLTVTTEQKGNYIRLSFADDGKGINPENKARLFTPFFTTKEVGQGTGLGLSISHGIISEHGGKIWAESVPGEGATFIIELPVYRQAEAVTA